MLNSKDKLTVRHFASIGSTYTDYSYQAFDFQRDTFTLTLATNDYLLVGYYKPINTLYVSMATPDAYTSTLTNSYYDGSSFATSLAHDDTKGLTRSGFIMWERNQTDEAITIIDSTELYWYKLALSSASTAIVFNGIGLLFSDDQDLLLEHPGILNDTFLIGSATDHLTYHISARNEIIQSLKIKGYKNSDGDSINLWDLLEVTEVKQASKYLALSNIFFNVSDSPDDVYSIKSKEYKRLYQDCMSLAYLSFDQSNDGLTQDSEKVTPARNIRFNR